MSIRPNPKILRRKSPKAYTALAPPPTLSGWQLGNMAGLGTSPAAMEGRKKRRDHAHAKTCSTVKQ